MRVANHRVASGVLVVARIRNIRIPSFIPVLVYFVMHQSPQRIEADFYTTLTDAILIKGDNEMALNIRRNYTVAENQKRLEDIIAALPQPVAEPIKRPRPPKGINFIRENVYMPFTATYLQWAWKVDDEFAYYQFPSKRIQGKLYNITIRKSDGLMECDCLGFGKCEPYKPAGVCSHIKKLRWVSMLKQSGGTRAVSLAARISISEEAMDEMKRHVVELIADRPRTCDECEVITGYIHQTCSPVIRNLFKAGFLEDSGDRRPTRRNRMAIVWQIS